LKLERKILLVVGVMMLGLMGCGQVNADETVPSELISSEELGAIPDGTQFSPELMNAVLAKIPKPTDAMLQPAAACMGTKTCTNLGFGACTSWSATYSCGSLSVCTLSDAACKDCAIGPDGKPDCWYTGGQNQGKNRYRVCLNPAGQSCTEYEYTTAKVCGCNDL
jgi:hypothetical protein